MRSTASSPLKLSRTTLQLGLCAAALIGAAAGMPDANAAVVTFSIPIAIPNTFSGVYINLVTGQSGSTPAAVPGWDFGPWGSGGTLAFFFPSTPANTSGAVATTASGPYLDLPPLSYIGPATTFSAVTTTAASLAFQSSGNHVLGFRLFNESSSQVNYGYMVINTTGPSGFPATITSWSFENTGAAIVPEPATAAMLGMGVLALGGWQLRRLRRRHTPA